MNLYTYDYLEKNGRLGNQLWQIAATIARAEADPDGHAYFRPDWDYRAYFSVPDFYFNPDPDPKWWNNIVDGGTEYFQDYANIKDIEDLVRMYFKPSQKADESCYLPRMGLDNETLCSIHVRRGDYLKHPNHFPIMTSCYYRTAVADVKSRHDDVHFVVFSDDIEWCMDNPDHFGLEPDEVMWVHGSVRPVEVVDRLGEPRDQIDLFAMMEMDEHIVSNSTFAWWGAYLSGNAAPIYPDRWFGSLVPNGVNWENAIPSGWRKFAC